MTEWKRRQIERRRLEEEFAKVAMEKFFGILADKTYGLDLPKSEMQLATKVCSEAAWSVARVMVKAR